MKQRLTYTQRLARLFQANPMRRFDGLYLAKIAGPYAWRSRVSDARALVQGRIENIQVYKKDGSKRSLYRFVPLSR